MHWQTTPHISNQTNLFPPSPNKKEKKKKTKVVCMRINEISNQTNSKTV